MVVRFRRRGGDPRDRDARCDAPTANADTPGDQFALAERDGRTNCLTDAAPADFHGPSNCATDGGSDAGAHILAGAGVACRLVRTNGGLCANPGQAG